jgi:translation initiation factor 2 subunit 1
MVKRKGLPEWGELVLCTVDRISPFAAWCTLDEYEGEGMIHVSEVSGKWVHDIREFIKPNKQYVAKVVKVDYQKNVVNLSLKRVSRNDEKQKLNSFRRSQRAEKMLELAAKELGKTIEQAYEEVGYLLQEKFGELYVAFEEGKESKDNLLKKGVSKEWADAIVDIVEKNLQEKETIIKADLELKSYEPDGIKKIKEILADIEKKTRATVKYISAPNYRIEIVGKDPKTTEKKIVQELEKVVQTMKQNGEASYKLIK